ncbi:hypothetical protein BGZ70_003630 [Mortierella alpina]|uniref:Uncharacterized protein n=1 Tax=Mortierella alpina TaxID=64518 RepID=A0A9P6M578_MORAP|nr:hypothetical protein BGZ70_003630 [Mortierella alpina]
MSSAHNNSNISDQDLEQRFIKLKETGASATLPRDQELAAHFLKVFGHQPVATLLSPPLEHAQDGQSTTTALGDPTTAGNRPTAPQRSASSYFIPNDSKLGQDEIDRILADSEDLLLHEDGQDDLGFLDELEDDILNSKQKNELKDNLTSHQGLQRSGEQELKNVTQDLEKTLSKFLQTHDPPQHALASSSSPSSPSLTASASHRDPSSAMEDLESCQVRAFEDRLERMSGLSTMNSANTTTGAGMFPGVDDDASQLINQAREEAQLEAKYSNQDEARMKELHSRHEQLKKGMQGLSSLRSNTSSQGGKEAEGLGPPPAAVGLDELRSVGGDDDEDPSNWCCKCEDC